MKVGLIAFNWQFDTALALWNLELYAKLDETIRDNVEFEQYCGEIPTSYGEEEATMFDFLQWVQDGEFDALGFSCYVWNIELINKIAKMVRSIHPDMYIIYGGQQIRGRYISQLFEKEKSADLLVEDEGEITFRQVLLNRLTGSPTLDEIGGLHYLDENGEIKSTGNPEVVKDLNDIPSPYDGTVDIPVGASYLMEASRGCPYKCGYCLWAEPTGVREYDLDRVEQELRHVLKHQPSHIMFCDGTFNMNRQRAKDILKVMIKALKDGVTGPFSCLVENRTELIDEETGQLLDELLELNPLLRLEFGLQSANPESSKTLRRRFSQEKFTQGWNNLPDRSKAHSEIDCIYALPGESVEDFLRTVDYAYSLSPGMVQCFRLNVLPGTNFETMREEYGFHYNDEPNHAVYRTKWLTAEEMRWCEAFRYACNDLYACHNVTVSSIMGLGLYESFSKFLGAFVDFTGEETILNALNGNIEPLHDGRLLNLSGLFLNFVKKITKDHEAQQRLLDLVEYEIMMAPSMGRVTLVENISELSDEFFVSNATLFKSNFNIQQFVTNNRYQSSSDIMEMEAGETYVALPKLSVADEWTTSRPKPMIIDNDYAKVIRTFRGGRDRSEGVSILDSQGYKSGNLDPMIDQLMEHGLLFSSLNRTGKKSDSRQQHRLVTTD